jgi:hypothetical protein
MSDDEIAAYAWMIEDAAKKAAASQEPEKILGTLLKQLPERLRAGIEARFRDKLAVLKASMPTGEAPAAVKPAYVPSPQQQSSRPLLFTMAQAMNLIAKGTLDKIKSMLKSKPSLEEEIKRVGQSLARSGVTPDAHVLEGQLGGISPVAGIGQGITKGPTTRA